MDQEESRYRMTASQKMGLYVFTLLVVTFVYVAPHIPVEVWKLAIWIPLVAIGGGLLVGALAIYMALRTGQKAMDINWMGFGRRRGGGGSAKGPVTVGRWSSEEPEAEGKKK